MSTPFIGRLEHCGIAKEGTRGTSTTPAFWIPKTDFSVENKHTYQNLDDTVGNIADSVSQKIVMTGAEGNIVARVGAESIGLILLASLGSVTDAVHAGETIVYGHTFSLANNNQHPSLTIELKNPVQQLRFALSMLDSLELRCEAGKVMEFTAGFKSKAGVVATDTPSYTAEKEFLMKHMTLKIATTQAGLSSATALNVKSLTMKPAKNIERNDTFGSLDPNDILNKSFAFEGTIVLLYDDATFKTLVDAGTPMYMSFDAKDTDNLIGVAAYPELNMIFNQVYFTAFEKTTGINDLATQTITFKATYNLTDAKMLSAVLTNKTASY